MAVVGRLLGTGVARSQSAPPVVYEIVAPSNTVPNLAYLVQEGERWRKTLQEFERLAGLGQLSWDLARRARFGTEVITSASELLRLNATNVVVAQDDFGKMLGLATYNVGGKEGYLNLQVIDPNHLAGSPGTSQLRGIGTAMTAAISRQMLKAGVETVYLHPFDSAAADFWMKRGFGVCGRGGLMCVRGRVMIEKLIGACIARPESPDRGDILCVGQPATVRGFSIPKV